MSNNKEYSKGGFQIYQQENAEKNFVSTLTDGN